MPFGLKFTRIRCEKDVPRLIKICFHIDNSTGILFLRYIMVKWLFINQKKSSKEGWTMP